MASDPLIDHLEKTFADAYRKEIDQEENVWRSLPFFAATLALQLAAIGLIREGLIGLSGSLLWAGMVLLGLTAFATLLALFFLASSIWPMKFQYPSTEPELQAYAKKLREHETASRDAGQTEVDALLSFKSALTTQYAIAADHNRKINQRRALRRTRAGVAILASITFMLALVAITMISQVHANGLRTEHTIRQ